MKTLSLNFQISYHSCVPRLDLPPIPTSNLPPAPPPPPLVFSTPFSRPPGSPAPTSSATQLLPCFRRFPLSPPPGCLRFAKLAAPRQGCCRDAFLLAGGQSGPLVIGWSKEPASVAALQGVWTPLCCLRGVAVEVQGVEG